MYGRCTAFLLLLFLVGCTVKEERQVQRSFYYWKTGFRLSPKEKTYLRDLSVKHLYIKLFDVSWDDERQAALPVAKSLFREAPPKNIAITPVVFITNETLVKSDTAQVNVLAERIASLLSSISTTASLQLSGEVQVDCDWTAGTKNKYFQLLEALRQTPFVQGKKLSATIRLHQLKYLSENGVPPVDKGLLMAYNMGNLRHPETGNSIIEPSELKKYIRSMDNYPLPLDVALPLFEWYVLFRQNSYKGLVHRLENDSLPWKNGRHVFMGDTVVGGYSFRRGDWLRHERSDAGEVKTCANLLAKKLKNREVNVILYHLDEYNLTKYQLYELESFYNSFR
ncbi:MAG TPA: hypothetical protein VGB46_11180 [Flavisolibacter sp.]